MEPLRALVFFLVLAGCSLTKPAVIQNPTAPVTASKTVSFPADYRGHIMKMNPLTWNEHYMAGAWLYRVGNYTEGTNHFLNAAELSNGEARRTCLAAAAVVALAGNDSRFHAIREKLKKTRDDNPFRTRTVTDKVAGTLEVITRSPTGGEETWRD